LVDFIGGVIIEEGAGESEGAEEGDEDGAGTAGGRIAEGIGDVAGESTDGLVK
jgi:hypothetical protein